MNLFINHENQTILWNTINRHPLFEKNKNIHEKEKWFQMMIEYTYANKSNINKTLQELNRDTIKHMIDTLKRQLPDPSIQLHQKSFDEIQTEYKKMLSNDPPKEIDFKEKCIDEPMHNINETLERYKKEREEMINISNINSMSSLQSDNEVLILLKEIKTELFEQKNMIKEFILRFSLANNNFLEPAKEN